MCSPPAKRSRAAISARRQQGFATSTRLSSSLTAAVIAIVSSPRGGRFVVQDSSSRDAQQGLQGDRERGRVVSGNPVRDGYRCEHQPRTQRFCRTMHRFGVAYGFPVGYYYIDSKPRQVTAEGRE